MTDFMDQRQNQRKGKIPLKTTKNRMLMTTCNEKQKGHGQRQQNHSLLFALSTKKTIPLSWKDIQVIDILFLTKKVKKTNGLNKVFSSN